MTPQGAVGSNPTLSAIFICAEGKAFGEVPKWLKGLPWKGSRSLIAARGFKSHFLRLIILDSSAVEQPAVNRWVVGSNPTRGAYRNKGV